MQKDALKAFTEMHAAATKEGIQLVIKSAARNFDYQHGIWQRKWDGTTTLSDGTKATAIADHAQRARKILEYSSMPGSSRHHWGTDIDINSFNNTYFAEGEGLELYTWMKNNAASYGYCQPYTAKGKLRPYGYNEEKWHWSYTPLSKIITAYAREHLTNADLQGFEAAEVADRVLVKERYILGISEECF